jgi:chorismate mutase
VRKRCADNLNLSTNFQTSQPRFLKIAAGFFTFEQSEHAMDIEYWRSEIDQIDMEILRLLNMRARLAIKVGALKKAADLPFCDPERERNVLDRMQGLNDGPLDTQAVGKLFRRIIRESRRVESRSVESAHQL